MNVLKRQQGGAISSAAASDIDEAALAAIKGNIGLSSKDELRQTVLLSFAMKNVPKLDANSKSDCFVVLY